MALYQWMVDQNVYKYSRFEPF